MSDSLLSLTGYQRSPFHRYDALNTQQCTDLVEETPVAISVNGITHAVMMATPIQLDAFVIGFARSEGMIEQLSDIRDIEIHPAHTQPDITSVAIELTLSPRQFAQFKQKRQSHLGATGCGLCGVESLSQAIPALPKLPPSRLINAAALPTLRSLLSDYQQLGNITGAIHAALLLSPEGDPIVCMEDIGRHNALDKVIGYALQQKINLHNHSVLMSSRCSTELVQKAVRVGLSHLIHLASPSTLAVKLAQYYGLTLIHLPKQDAPRIFASSIQSEGKNND
ncbi:formate dehydrogenase accessory sulfurtransferase FdhD [Marinomonas sp. M1K-6]|uniref:Sulfur carrier protein FdhD n=1 Tax=Marinomonas profundi TaxID=2726122 RepID=A0A847R8F8_9GAMM|nr:formate dehydrogenase accessory sulfurtransferase FdhD [Marinomonas profundi]NLQ18356.1 formate dehydrogenase accessory sulfurtransferase FdhD [Marinomonas profundi]UDV02418.1 formate dehydrogenase accessory sulfurtransferase FdhD [Marinomonas profundi]